MTLSAIQRRKLQASIVACGCLAVVSALSASPSRARSPEAAASPSPEVVAATSVSPTARGANPYSDHFPNLVLKTHEGRNVYFYDDLLKGKIVLINFMYATCTER